MKTDLIKYKKLAAKYKKRHRRSRSVADKHDSIRYAAIAGYIESKIEPVCKDVRPLTGILWELPSDEHDKMIKK